MSSSLIKLQTKSYSYPEKASKWNTDHKVETQEILPYLDSDSIQLLVLEVNRCWIQTAELFFTLTIYNQRAWIHISICLFRRCFYYFWGLWLADSSVSGLRNHWSFLTFLQSPSILVTSVIVQPPTGDALFRTDMWTFWRTYRYCFACLLALWHYM